MFQSRALTQDELDKCPKIVLTGLQTWNPQNITLGDTEMDNLATQVDLCMDSCEVQIQPLNERGPPTHEHLKPKSNFALSHVPPNHVENLKERSLAQIQESTTAAIDPELQDLPITGTCASTERHARLTAFTLSENIGIGVEGA